MSLKIKNAGGGGGSADIVNGVAKNYLSYTETIDPNNFIEFVGQVDENAGISIINSYTLPNSGSIYTNYYGAKDLFLNVIDDIYLLSYQVDSKQCLGTFRINFQEETVENIDSFYFSDPYNNTDTISYTSTGVNNNTICKIDDFKYLVLYRVYKDSSNMQVYSFILTLNSENYSILNKTSPVLVSDYNTNTFSNNVKLIKMNDKKALFLLGYGLGSGSSYFYYIKYTLIDFENNSITLNTNNFIYSSSKTINFLKLELLKENTAVLYYHDYDGSNNKSRHLYLLTLNGDVLNVSSNNSSLLSSYTEYDSTNLLNIGNDKFILFLYNRILLMSVPFSILDDFTITDFHSPYNGDVLKYANNTIFRYTSYISNSKRYLYISTYTIDNDKIVEQSSNNYEIEIGGTNNSFVIANASGCTDDFAYFLIYGNPYRDSIDSFMRTDMKQLIRKSVSKIDGITKTTATTTIPGQVYVLNTN